MNVTCVKTFEPPEFDVLNEIEKFPIPNTCAGFLLELNVNTVLFPVTFVAVHCQLVGLLIDVSVN